MSEAGDATAARGIAKNTVVLVLARIIDRGTTLVLTLVLAAKLGPTGVGTYALALAMYGVLTSAGDAGTILFALRELAADKTRTASYIVHLSAIAGSFAVALTALAEILIQHVGYSSQTRTTLALILLAVLPKTLNGIQEATFTVYGRTELEATTTLVTSVIYVVTSVVLLAGGYGVEAIVASYVVLEYLATIVYYVLVTRSIARLRLQFRWSLARRLMAELKPFAASSAVAALFGRPEIIILSLLSTTRQVGYYSAAVRVCEIWLFVPEVFLDNAFPLLARAHLQGSDRFGEIQARLMRYSLLYALPLTAGMLALADPIVQALFGHSFSRSAVELQVLAVNVTLFTLVELYWRSVSARGHQGALLRVTLLTIVTRLSIGTAVIAALASLGAAISATFGAAVHAGLLRRLTQRTGGSPRLIQLGWRVTTAAALMGGESWLLAHWLSIWIVIPIAAATYVAALAALRALPPGELQTLRMMLPTRMALDAK